MADTNDTKTDTGAETFAFSADINQLMSLIIKYVRKTHSLYYLNDFYH